MKKFEPDSIAEYLDELDRDYMYELCCLQVELLQLQKYVTEQGIRLAIVFEGRDTAGKGGAILRFRQHLIPRYCKVVALHKPTDEERGQWYFQRYIQHLPKAGAIVLFDRSWYNRAVVEPVMGFCSSEEHERFMEQVNIVEKLWVDDGIKLIKLWFSIDQEEQGSRLQDRQLNPLKTWKLSPVDLAAREKWDEFTSYKEKMFAKTSPSHSPWVRIDGNEKKVARLESIRYVLSQFDYPNKGFTGVSLEPSSKAISCLVSPH
ncbi:polyphosphate kinase 2 [Pseudobacteriovorax antillogorgiicola]|uniref:ADP/GDP-polyphosphate phosphotransferase n=1 Tax=Pseudobacteriovorax antillogorgiicola TaxID=1513793 RepID=A0A1Y6BDY6_9BACT|nr:polyphosphate kinase 2 [Pseudobacteriovorax antillogorgiicola]TCS56362.1 polyphosphate kinase 2 [Pseudobacteriovorax antillogorgiicola]SMF06674.1 polyphosphate kinase 2, PA0141 family [Pseudobacteriovorax antillogorgiicola]